MLTQEDDVEIHALGCARAGRCRRSPAHRPRPQDGPQVPGRRGRRPAARAGAELPGAVSRLHRGALRRRPAPGRDGAASRARRRGVRSRPIRRWSASCAGSSCGRSARSASTAAAGAVTVEIEHPPGEEIQWDWLELDRDAVGRAGVRAGRRAVALGPLPRRVLRADDLRAPGRGDAPGARRAGRHAAGLAHRPDGHDRDPRHRPADRRRRAGGQALRRRDRGLPAAARAAQGRRRGARSST